MLRSLHPVQNCLSYLLPHSLLSSTVLCSIEIAPIQSCAVHVLALQRGLKHIRLSDFWSQSLFQHFPFRNLLTNLTCAQFCAVHCTHPDVSIHTEFPEFLNVLSSDNIGSYLKFRIWKLAKVAVVGAWLSSFPIELQ